MVERLVANEKVVGSSPIARSKLRKFMDDLANKKCIPCEGGIPAFDKSEIHKYLKKMLFFGIGSAICLVIHSIFLGIKFDLDAYKLFRRVIMLSFIIFEIAAQTYFVLIFYSIKSKLKSFIFFFIVRLF